ncbi:hypothetical protein PVAP13_1NG389819 [Panicum virgatum]|uniref:Uncharacterized protein n=1 Tax=Panicum virgatum TaxID=38727 RepID=A0A8T0X2G5_PANVG|nr:hypothetical protein PVAP13_1NG389819 [Panicum virgatum]
MWPPNHESPIDPIGAGTQSASQGVGAGPGHDRTPHNHQLHFEWSLSRRPLQMHSTDTRLDDFPEPVTASWPGPRRPAGRVPTAPRALAPWPVATVRRAWTTRQRSRASWRDRPGAAAAARGCIASRGRRSTSALRSLSSHRAHGDRSLRGSHPPARPQVTAALHACGRDWLIGSDASSSSRRCALLRP